MLAFATLAYDAHVDADVIEIPRPCAPWQDRTNVGHHGVGACVDRVCRTDAQCSGGHCYNPTLVCVVGESVVGPCSSSGTCEQGTCVTRGRCGS
jgi:hypothetical protein